MTIDPHTLVPGADPQRQPEGTNEELREIERQRSGTSKDVEADRETGTNEELRQIEDQRR